MNSAASFSPPIRIVKADLHCARPAAEQDLDKIKAELKSLYDATEVLLDVSVDESLLSGYILAGGRPCV